jgi:hypothetical protein
VAADEGDHRLVHRAVALDADVVALADVVDQHQRLAVQHAGVERGDGDRQAICGDQVGEDLVLGAEARCLDDAAGVRRAARASRCRALSTRSSKPAVFLE